jgi:hypothetical protein
MILEPVRRTVDVGCWKGSEERAGPMAEEDSLQTLGDVLFSGICETEGIDDTLEDFFFAAMN